MQGLVVDGVVSFWGYALLYVLLLLSPQQVQRVEGAYTELTADAKCQGGSLIQYSDNYFMCKCDDTKVHSEDIKCEPKSDVCKLEGQVCGEYARCVKKEVLPPPPSKAEPREGLVREDELECKCKEGYELDDKKICIPQGCKALQVTCGVSGICVKKGDAVARDVPAVKCVCLVGVAGGGDKKCEGEETNAAKNKCNLKCPGENTACILNTAKYYTCGCAVGYELKNGICTKIEEPEKGCSAPAYGILNVGILFLVSAVIYGFV